MQLEYTEGDDMDPFLEQGEKNPLKIQDNTFRDGHQSLLATRMRTEDMLPIAEKMDSVGFWAMEVWGGRRSIRCTDSWPRTRSTASAP